MGWRRGRLRLLAAACIGAKPLTASLAANRFLLFSADSDGGDIRLAYYEYYHH